MPPALVKAHAALDKAVDAAYLAAEKTAGRKPPKLTTDAERVAFLFERYQALTSLLPVGKPKRARKRKVPHEPAHTLTTSNAFRRHPGGAHRRSCRVDPLPADSVRSTGSPRVLRRPLAVDCCPVPAAGRSCARGPARVYLGDDLRGMLGPLPDAGTDRVVVQRASGMPASLAHRAAATVGERLLSALEDRIRHGSGAGRGRRRGGSVLANAGLNWLLGKFIFAALMALVFGLALQSVFATLLQPPRPGAAVPGASSQTLPAPSVQRGQAALPMPAPAQPGYGVAADDADRGSINVRRAACGNRLPPKSANRSERPTKRCGCLRPRRRDVSGAASVGFSTDPYRNYREFVNVIISL